jgi:hypothetical protein
MYGLKQTPKELYQKINIFSSILVSKAMNHITIYIPYMNGETLIVSLHVHNLLITKNNVDLILGFNK